MNKITRIIINAVFTVAYILITPPQEMYAQNNTEQTYFEYPKVPDNLETLTERSNFFIENFWKRCNMKSAFSSRAKMAQAFNDYISFMPYADAKVVHASIDKLIADVSKNPKNLLTLAEIAEGALYADTARIACDECYLPFAQAVANNRKISKAEKARFEYQATALASSQVGMTAPELAYTRPDGTKGKLSELTPGAYVLLFFNDPDCTECELARIRLSADANLNDLVSSGKIIVLSIYPGEADDEWRDRTSVYNSRWEVGAAPDADEYYDMRNPPVIYYLNGDHTILSKTFDIDNLIEAFRQVNAKISKGNS